MDYGYTNILVAFDHSEHSLLALDRGIEIGKKFNSNFNVVFVITATNNDDEFKAISYIEAKEIEENVKLNLTIKKGNPYQVIIEEQKKLNANLVILGSHGVSGFLPNFLGSTAFKVANSCSCPVLIIPENSKNFNFNKLLMPIDSTSETRQKFGYVHALAKAFNSEVCVLGVSKNKDTQTLNHVHIYMSQAEQFMQSRGVKSYSKMDIGQKVAPTILENAETEACGLIFTMTENESAGFLMGPAAQQLVNTSTFPVFCIHNHEVEGIGGTGL